MCSTCNGNAVHTPSVAHAVVTAPAVTTPGTATTGTAAPIVTQVAPGFTGGISIRIVPGTELFPKAPEATCTPRGDRPPAPRPFVISSAVEDVLTTANSAVIAWLAESRDNAEQFVADPVGALARAGVELTRAQANELRRAHGAVRYDAVLPPGARVTKLTVAATTRGKVGDGRPIHDRPKHDRPTDDKPTHDRPGTGDPGCGC